MKGEYIIRQGATGDTFFIINEGSVSSIVLGGREVLVGGI